MCHDRSLIIVSSHWLSYTIGLDFPDYVNFSGAETRRSPHRQEFLDTPVPRDITQYLYSSSSGIRSDSSTDAETVTGVA